VKQLNWREIVSLFDEITKNAKVINGPDGFGYLKSDDVEAYLESLEPEEIEEDDFECSRDTLPKEMLK
jgi:hypothetical protein